MMVDDVTALDAIRCLMKNEIAIINDGKRRRPILNTSRKKCYDVLWMIRSIIQDNENYHVVKIMEELHEKEKMLTKQEDDKEIQHVGYSQEACGYEK